MSASVDPRAWMAPSSGRWRSRFVEARGTNHLSSLFAAIVLGAVAGVASAVLPPALALALTVALLILVAAWIGAMRASVSPAALPVVLFSVSLGLVACDALRFSSATYGDVGILVAAVWAVVAKPRLVERVLRLPTWLLGGSALVFASALLSGLFAPVVIPHLIRDRLFTSNVTTGAAVQASAVTLVAELLFALFVVPACVALICDSGRRIKLATDLWLAGIAASCVVSLLQATTSLDVEKLLVNKVYSFTGLSRFAGLTVHPVLLGISAAIAAPVALSRVRGSHPARYWALVALYCGAILVSGTRAALVAVIGSYIVIVALQRRGRRTLVVTALVACALIPLTGLGSTSSLSRVFGSAAQSQSNLGSTAAHGQEISAGIDAALQRPITGWGFQSIKGAHDVPLQTATSGGVIALIGYMIVIGGALVAGVRMASGRPELVGLVGALTAFSLSGLVSNAIIDRFLYVPIGLIAAWWLLESREAAVTRPGGRGDDRRPLLAIADPEKS